MSQSKNKPHYYLQLSYARGARREQWYWDGAELIPKPARHPSHCAKVYTSKTGAVIAAKRLQIHVERFADRVKQPAELLSLKPVRVTW
jgi:hypothetical protein